MSIKPLKYELFGEHAVLISWEQQITEAIRDDILYFEQMLHHELSDFFVETVLGYCSLTIFLKAGTNGEDFLQKTRLIHRQNPVEGRATQPTLWNIPVCYDPSFGWDIEAFARAKSMTPEEVILLHTQTTYQVYFLGFLPGFAYLGGLDEKLHLSRRAKPRVRVPQGAVAIGGQQTGIYPIESPGGWHILGQTPISFFQPDQSPPSFLAAGHRMRFYSIGPEEFHAIREKAQKPIPQ